MPSKPRMEDKEKVEGEPTPTQKIFDPISSSIVPTRMNADSAPRSYDLQSGHE